jgi:hypothetical protein
VSFVTEVLGEEDPDEIEKDSVEDQMAPELKLKAVPTPKMLVIMKWIF